MEHLLKILSEKYQPIDASSHSYNIQMYQYGAYYGTFWFVVYSWIYYRFHHKSGMWRSCIGGILHALWVIVGALLAYYQNGWIIFSTTDSNEDASQTDDSLMLKMCVMSMTWFTLDTIHNVIYDIELFVTIPHHISSAYALYHALSSNLYVNEVFFMLFIMEVSNPFMCVNAMLKLDKKTDAWAFAIVERLFELVFVIMRVFVGGWFTFAIFKHLGNVHWSVVLAMGYIHLFTILVLFMIGSNVYKRDIKGMRRYGSETEKSDKQQ